MRKTHSCLVFLMILVLGLSPALPAEDLPGTAYDESETLPFESSLPISKLIARISSATQTAMSETHAVRNATNPQVSTPILLSARPISRTDSPRFTEARSLLAHACTFLL